MIKVLDQYYFKELPQEELKKQLARAVVRKDGVHSMDDLSAVMEAEQNIDFPED
jgi:uncharacterized protein YqeY